MAWVAVIVTEPHTSEVLHGLREDDGLCFRYLIVFGPTKAKAKRSIVSRLRYFEELFDLYPTPNPSNALEI